MTYGLVIVCVVLAVSLGGVIYDNVRKERLIERLVSEKLSLPPEKVVKTGIISPYRKPMNGGDG